MDFDEQTIVSILDGLSADADIRNGVFSTTSQALALQYRLLLRMQGHSTHIRRTDNHGGLGKNPIYRVTPRQDGNFPHARVKSIGEGERSQTYDIEVEGHRFYLPETDLIVHNCDDASMMVAALAGAVGFTVGLRAWGDLDTDDFQHVYAVAMLPKLDPREVVGLDTTVEEAEVGWEPPEARVLTAWIEED